MCRTSISSCGAVPVVGSAGRPLRSLRRDRAPLPQRSSSRSPPQWAAQPAPRSRLHETLRRRCEPLRRRRSGLKPSSRTADCARSATLLATFRALSRPSVATSPAAPFTRSLALAHQLVLRLGRGPEARDRRADGDADRGAEQRLLGDEGRRRLAPAPDRVHRRDPRAARPGRPRRRPWRTRCRASRRRPAHRAGGVHRAAARLVGGAVGAVRQVVRGRAHDVGRAGEPVGRRRRRSAGQRR